MHDVTELLQSHAYAGRILETIELRRLNSSGNRRSSATAVAASSHLPSLWSVSTRQGCQDQFKIGAK
jgi:hypothetical protein